MYLWWNMMDFCSYVTWQNNLWRLLAQSQSSVVGIGWPRQGPMASLGADLVDTSIRRSSVSLSRCSLVDSPKTRSAEPPIWMTSMPCICPATRGEPWQIEWFTRKLSAEMNPGMFLQGLLPTSSDRRARPVSRSGGLLFAAATSVFIYGGSRPTRKGGDSLQILDDLWRARLGSDGNALWEQLTAEGEADHSFEKSCSFGGC